MSDAPDQKVEDVLSSVRRLVSNEVPRKQRAEVPMGPGALVLTKDHMVSTDRAPQAASRSLEDRIAELEEAVGGQDAEFEPDGSEDQAQHRPDRIVYQRTSDLDDRTGRKSSRRLSKISMVETGPANGEVAPAGDSEVPSDRLGVAEFRRESQVLATPTSDKTDTSTDSSQDAIENKNATDTGVEAPMVEDVPTMARPSAEVTAFSDPDDVVRTFEARIEAGRPISDPSPLLSADTGADQDTIAPSEIQSKEDTKAKTKALEETPEDFDTALTNAVAASLSGLDQTETGVHAPEDYLDAGEFDGSNDPELTAAQILSAESATALETKSEPSEPLLLNENQNVKLETVAQETENKASQLDEKTEISDVTPSDEAAANGDTVANPDVAEPQDGASDQVVAALANMPDEDAMRLLIARMIRAELQGDLGEQITRNVRKLVRREIKRALSAEDLT